MQKLGFIFLTGLVHLTMQQYASAFHFLSASINLRYTLLPLPLSLHQPQVHAPSTSSQPPSTSGTRSFISSQPPSTSGTRSFISSQPPSASGTRSFNPLSLHQPQVHAPSFPLSLHQPQVHAPSTSSQPPSTSGTRQIHFLSDSIYLKYATSTSPLTPFSKHRYTSLPIHPSLLLLKVPVTSSSSHTVRY